jgi:hypothetical protein
MQVYLTVSVGQKKLAIESIITALGWLRQEGYELEAGLGCLWRSCLKKKKKTKLPTRLKSSC